MSRAPCALHRSEWANNNATYGVQSATVAYRMQLLTSATLSSYRSEDPVPIRCSTEAGSHAQELPRLRLGRAAALGLALRNLRMAHALPTRQCGAG